MECDARDTQWYSLEIDMNAVSCVSYDEPVNFIERAWHEMFMLPTWDPDGIQCKAIRKRCFNSEQMSCIRILFS